MYVLAVDTSTSYVIAGVVDTSAGSPDHPGAPHTLAHRTEFNPRGHMEVLTPNILACLRDAGLRPSDIGAVVVGTGPGPFTGLRVGMATGAAFGEALSVPVHGVESHVATACGAGVSGELGASGASELSGSVGPEASNVLVVSDARRREWYWTVVDPTTAAVVEGPAVTPPAELTALRNSAWVLASREVAPALPDSWELRDADAHPTPEGLVSAALVRAGADGLASPGEPLRALYLRRPDAVEPAPASLPEALDFSGVDLGAPEDTPVVVPLTVENAAACARIEAEVFAGDSPWSQASFRSEITAPHTRYLGLFQGDELLGYAGLALTGPVADPEFEIHTIALSPVAQGNGWSRLLMDPLIELADRHGVAVFLEVRTDNDPAVGLYRAYGFEIVGTRRNYYRPSGADAYTMTRPGSSRTVSSPVLSQHSVPQSPAVGEGDPVGAANPVEGTDRPRIILGVESSCDETGVGIVELSAGGAVRQISNRVASSMEQHARFGGVVPEIASRAHLEAFVPTLRAARGDLAAATGGCTRPDAVAATVGPGLAGALLVGAAAAKACAAAWEVPFYGVNHLGGHVAVDTLRSGAGVCGEALSGGAPGASGSTGINGMVPEGSVDTNGDGDTGIPDDLPHAVALLVSGGHTQILEVRGLGRPMVELGSTLDDAAGEAYDKVARLLGLGYPGGPVIDRLAASGDPEAIAFPRGLSKASDAPYDLSFSGLKTAVARYVEQAGRRGERIAVEDLCASFQEAVVDVLTAKAVRACRDTGATVLLLGGGVSANHRLRELAAQRCAEAGVTLHVPPPSLCTDNGVMIATLAAQLIAAGEAPSGLWVGTDPSMDVELPCLPNPVGSRAESAEGTGSRRG